MKWFLWSLTQQIFFSFLLFFIIFLIFFFCRGRCSRTLYGFQGNIFTRFDRRNEQINVTKTDRNPLEKYVRDVKPVDQQLTNNYLLLLFVSGVCLWSRAAWNCAQAVVIVDAVLSISGQIGCHWFFHRTSSTMDHIYISLGLLLSL